MRGPALSAALPRPCAPVTGRCWGCGGHLPADGCSWPWCSRSRWDGSLACRGSQVPEVLDLRIETVSLGFITVPGERGLSPGPGGPCHAACAAVCRRSSGAGREVPTASARRQGSGGRLSPRCASWHFGSILPRGVFDPRPLSLEPPHRLCCARRVPRPALWGGTGRAGTGAGDKELQPGMLSAGLHGASGGTFPSRCGGSADSRAL